MYKTIVGPDGKVIEVSDINYPVVKAGIYTTDEVIDMLEKLKAEIEEKEQYYQDKFLEEKNAVHDAAMCGRMFGCGECKEIVQQKINKLKEKI